MNDEGSHARPPGSSAVNLPKMLRRSQGFTVRLEGWTEFASSGVEVHIELTSPESYLSFRPLRAELDVLGNGSVKVPRGFDGLVSGRNEIIEFRERMALVC